MILLNVVRKLLIDKSTKNLRQSLETRHSKIVISKFSEQRTSNLLKLQRDELRNLIEFYTGYARFRRYLQNMRMTGESKCKFCEDEVPLKSLKDYAGKSHSKF